MPRILTRVTTVSGDLLEGTAPLSRGQQRSMRRFTINLMLCIKRVTREDDSQSRDVRSREETSSLSSYAEQDEVYKAKKGHSGIRRRWSDKCSVRVCTRHTKRNRTTITTGEGTPDEIPGQTVSDSE